MKKIPIHTLPLFKESREFDIEFWNDSIENVNDQIPHRHSFSEILVLTEGEAIHEIDFEEFDFQFGSIHFINAQCVHLLKRKEKNKGFSILFSDTFLPFKEFNQHIDFNLKSKASIFKFSKQEFEQVKVILTLIKEEFLKKETVRKEILQVNLYNLLFHLQRQNNINSFQELKKPAFAEKFEKLIEENFKSHWKVNQYADKMKMSVPNLSAHCNKFYSHSAQHVINQRVLLEIKRYLVYSDKSIKEICFDLNFEDASYFNRFFKKNVGTSPLKFRNSSKS